MYENKRRHYRVAQREINETPLDGIYVTKEEMKKYFFAASLFSLFTLILLLPLALRKN